MDKQGDKERQVIHITIDKVVMNFNKTGMVVNANGGVVIEGFRVLRDSCIEEVERIIHKNSPPA